MPSNILPPSEFYVNIIPAYHATSGLPELIKSLQQIIHQLESIRRHVLQTSPSYKPQIRLPHLDNEISQLKDYLRYLLPVKEWEQ